MRRLAALSPAEWLALPVLSLLSLLSLLALRLLSLPRTARWVVSMAGLGRFMRSWERRRVVGVADLAARVAQGRERCLARSLLLFGLLRARGEDPAFRLGVDRRDGKLNAHAWLEPESAAGYETLLSWREPPRVRKERALSPEDEVVLIGSRGTLGAGHEARLRELLAPPLRWPYVLHRAELEGTFPLLHRHLSPLEVPRDAWARLDARFKANAFRNELLAEELAGVLRRFGGAGIPAIPLKGPLLALQLYGDIHRRVCADLDVLVPLPRVDEALRLLQEAGYDPSLWPEVREESFFRDGHGLPVARIHEGFKIKVDLHWKIGSPVDRRSMDDLWATSLATSFRGEPVRTLSPVWQFLFLASHAARHSWVGLKWLADLHELCGRGSIDRARLGSLAARLGWERIVSLTMGACGLLYGTELPTAAPRVPTWLPLFPREHVSKVFSTALPFLHVLDRPASKATFLFRRLFQPLGAARLARLAGKGVRLALDCWGA